MKYLYRLFYFFYFIFFPFSAFAYLDPGTGSLLLYALVGLFATVAFALRNFWYIMRGILFGGRQGRLSRIALPDIVFHSEGGKYWQVFEPVVRALKEMNIPCAFITPDPNDPSFTCQNGLFTVINPGNDMMTVAFMNTLKTRLVVSTTPHLDVYMWKKSKGVMKYAHLFHAPTGIDFYDKYALNYYDIVLTVGDFQKEAINALDRKRNLPQKVFYPVGCTYFDFMIAEQRRQTRTAESFTVLYAPSWGQRSSVMKYGTAIIDVLAEKNIPVIFRPHPQFYVSHADLIAEIEKKYALSGIVSIDTERTAISSMVNSDLLITDLSGILFDWAYLFEKPVILANSEAETGGYEAEDLGGESWDVVASRALSHVLGDIAGLPAAIEKIRHEEAVSRGTVSDFRSRNIYNFGCAGKAAADTIVKIIGEIN